jgi:hypothetical protein
MSDLDKSHGEAASASADCFMSLTDIGWEWDISNRVLGKELELAGYKAYGGPTKKALDEGLAARQNGTMRWSPRAVGDFILKCGCSERFTPRASPLVHHDAALVRSKRKLGECRWVVACDSEITLTYLNGKRTIRNDNS